MDFEQIFLSQLPFIERVAEHTAHRYRFSPEEAEDLCQEVKLRLVQDDYRVLRQYQSKSTLPTYLTTVIKNIGRDYANHLWGKWRASAEAERLGEVGVRLDELLSKEGYNLQQAYERLKSTIKEDLTFQQVAELASKLPVRVPRRKESEETLLELPSSQRADQRILSLERATERRRALVILKRAIEGLPSDDRLILGMKILKGIKVSNIARARQLDQKALYRRIERIEKALKEQLEREGIGPKEVKEILEDEEP